MMRCAGAGHHQAALGVPAGARVLARQQVAIGPVRGGVVAVEQAGARQQQRARAGRGAACRRPRTRRAARRPRRRRGRRAAVPGGIIRSVMHRHVGPRAVGKARIGRDAHAVAALEGLAVGADHQRAKGRGRVGPAVQHLPVAPRAVERVVEAVQRGGADGGGAEQGHGDGLVVAASWHVRPCFGAIDFSANARSRTTIRLLDILFTELSCLPPSTFFSTPSRCA